LFSEKSGIIKEYKAIICLRPGASAKELDDGFCVKKTSETRE